MKKNSRIVFLLIMISTSNLSNIFSQEKLPLDSTNIVSKTIPDSSCKKIKREILIPINFSNMLQDNLSEKILSKNIIDNTDYRYTADYFTNVQFGFVRDLGSIGQPYEVLLNGNGFGKVSFLSDGISINNRLLNSFDLNHFQSESIGSIEIIPLSMGFLFGNVNNPVTINFISRQPGIQKPFSRIKFYQAPNAEGFIDGIFCVTPFRKLNTYFEITNQGVNPYYTNTDLSNWLGSVRMNYLFSNTLNLLASYKYHKTIPQLNGGVDIDQISQSYPASQINTILYDNIEAPIKYINRYEKSSGHNLNIHLLGSIYPFSFTDLSFYYQSHLTEFRQNEGQTDYQDNAASIVDDNQDKTIGLNLRQNFSFDVFRLSVLVNYEKNKYISPLLKDEINKDNFSIAGIASTKLVDSTFEPTVFAKYLSHFGSTYLGFGACAAISLDKRFKLSAGFSSFEKPYTIFEETFLLPSINLEKQKFNVLEVNAEYSSDWLNTKVGFFNQGAANSLLSAIENDSLISDRAIFFSSKNISLNGINLNMNLKIWKLLFYTNTSYYLNAEDRKDYNVPEFTSSSGVYYIDTLFDRNLKLKTGLNFYSVGHQNYPVIDYEKSISSVYSWNPYNQSVSTISANLTPTTFQMDFFLSGKIRDAATVYIVFQNLLDEQYYITPYYPKQGRGLRFGITWEFLD